MNWARTGLRLWLSLMTLAIAAQFLFASAGAFGAMSYDAHKMIGGMLMLAGLIAVLLAALARQFLVGVGVGFILLIVQFVLGHNGIAHPWLGALHGLNALAIGAVIGSTAGRSWRLRRNGISRERPRT